MTLYTALRVFLRWYADEYATPGWNPLAKVKPPKRPKERLSPLSLTDFAAMVDGCSRRSFNGDRDRALLLLDTGIRHQELTDLRVGDVDVNTGAVVVRMGKGRKGRAVFIGAKTRRALLADYRHRESLDDDLALWVKSDGAALTKPGIRQVVRRAALRARVDEPGMHEFRRAFAINSLRNGMDVATLQRLLGHSSIETVNRYLALVDDDLRTATGLSRTRVRESRRGGTVPGGGGISATARGAKRTTPAHEGGTMIEQFAERKQGIAAAALRAECI